MLFTVATERDVVSVDERVSYLA